MDLLRWVLIGVAMLVVAVVLAGQAGLLRGQPPAGLGAPQGKLRPPSATENSVSSQAQQHPDHPMFAYARIDPLRYTGDGAQALQGLADIVRSMAGAQVVREQHGYLYATFTSRWLKFVDDVEFVVDDAAGVIHVRSASRLGRKDFGVNRARVEAIRARFER